MRRDQRDLEHVAATERVEAVLHAVLAEGDVDPGRHQLADPGRAATDQPAVAAALDHQVRHRVGDDGDAGPRAAGDHVVGVVVVGRRQRARRARPSPGPASRGARSRPRPSRGCAPSRRRSRRRACRRRRRSASASVEAEPHVLALRRPRCAPSAACHRRRRRRACIASTIRSAAPGIAQDALLREGDGLHLGDVGAVPGGREHALERHQPADGVDVDVRAQPGVPVSTDDSMTARGAPAYVLDGVGALGRVDRVDRAAQRAVVLGQLVADQHLVEVDVGVDVGRQQQPAGSVDLVVGRAGRRPAPTAAICPSSTTTSTREPSTRVASTIASRAIRPSDHRSTTMGR